MRREREVSREVRREMEEREGGEGDEGRGCEEREGGE